MNNIKCTPYGNFKLTFAPGDVMIPRNFGEGPGSTTVNLRVSKTFSLGSKSKLEAMLNVYNAFNAATTISEVTAVGAAFGKPQQIMTPVIVGLGAHLTF